MLEIIKSLPNKATGPSSIPRFAIDCRGERTCAPELEKILTKQRLSDR